MRNLINNAVDWDSLTGGRIAKEQFSYELGQGVMHKETGVLVIPMTLNFVLPYDELLKIKALVKSKLDFVEDVKFRFRYKDILMNEEEIIRHYIPYLMQILESNGSGFAKAIDSNAFEIREGEKRTLVLHCFGKTCEEQLNETVSGNFERILMRSFGLKFKVVFENDHEEYQEKAEDLISDIKDEMVQIIEENNAKAQEAGSRPKEHQETESFNDNGRQSQGGWSGGKNKGNWKKKEEDMIMGSQEIYLNFFYGYRKTLINPP